MAKDKKSNKKKRLDKVTKINKDGNVIQHYSHPKKRKKRLTEEDIERRRERLFKSIQQKNPKSSISKNSLRPFNNKDILSSALKSAFESNKKRH